MINQDFKAQGTKYQVLPNLGICCRELAGLKVTSFCACVCSFCSVGFLRNYFMFPLYCRNCDGLKFQNLKFLLRTFLEFLKVEEKHSNSEC